MNVYLVGPDGNDTKAGCWDVVLVSADSEDQAVSIVQRWYPGKSLTCTLVPGLISKYGTKIIAINTSLED